MKSYYINKQVKDAMTQILNVKLIYYKCSNGTFKKINENGNQIS